MAQRPTKYTPELADAIVEMHACGQLLTTICKAPAMPSRSTLYRWMDDRPEFKVRIERAHEHCADALVDEMQDIADTEKDPTRAKVKIATRQWLAAKLAPKKYGDRVDVNVSGTISVSAALAEARARALGHPSGAVIDVVPIIAEPVARAVSGRQHASDIRDMDFMD